MGKELDILVKIGGLNTTKQETAIRICLRTRPIIFYYRPNQYEDLPIIRGVFCDRRVGSGTVAIICNHKHTSVLVDRRCPANCDGNSVRPDTDRSSMCRGCRSCNVFTITLS